MGFFQLPGDLDKYTHAFSIYPDHLRFLGLFCALILCGAGYSTILRLVAPKMPYGFLILGTLAVCFAVCLNGNYLDISPPTCSIILLSLGAICAFLACRYSPREDRKQSLWTAWRRSNSPGELIECVITWVLGIGFVFVPLAFAYPIDALIVGAGDCDDGMVHSILSRGLSGCRALIPSTYCERHALGIQSFLYYLNSLTIALHPSRIILPGSLCVYSLVVFWAQGIMRTFSVPLYFRVLLSQFAVSSFLVTTAAYIGFLSQTAALPFLLAAMTVLVTEQSFGSLKVRLIIFAILGLGAVVCYGLLAASALGVVGTFVCIGAIYRENSVTRAYMRIREFMKVLCSPEIIVSYILLGAMLWPILESARVVWELEHGDGGAGGGYVSKAVGNLFNGYLSPLHLTGLWPVDMDYRDLPSRQSSGFMVQLGCLLLLQVWLLATSQNIRRIRSILYGLFAMYVAACLVIESPYVQFKYLSYSIPVFVLSSGVAYVEHTLRITGHVWKYTRPCFVLIAMLPLVLYLERALINPLKRVARTNIHTAKQFLLLESVAAEVANKRALILSREPWLHSFVQPDDLLPMTLYFNHRTPEAQDQFDVVIRDRFAGARDLDGALEKLPGLLDVTHREQCRTKTLEERFDVYNAHCQM